MAFALCSFLLGSAHAQPPPAASPSLSVDDPFLERVEQDSFRYFWETADPTTGLIPDSDRPGSPSSIAAVGFGLTAICIADSRHWVTHDEAYQRVVKILNTAATRLKREHGFFYHFVEMDTGARAWDSEVSSIDTALFLAGALMAAEYFHGTEVERLAHQLYEDVDWAWMMNGGLLMRMGWRPESGFLDNQWDWYSEGMLAYALAIGSLTHPIAPKTWWYWKRPTGTYGGYRVVYSYFGSLFTYQFAQAWIDFRHVPDGDLNYWDNSINAALANRHFCMDHAGEHATYGEDHWGLTAGDGPTGYKSYGALPAETAMHDGTINPYGMVAAVPLVPYLAIPSIKTLYAAYGEKIYGAYGFRAGFNLERNWWSRNYLGIDQGVSVLMLENYRTGMVWDVFMRSPYIAAWKQRCFPPAPPTGAAADTRISPGVSDGGHAHGT